MARPKGAILFEGRIGNVTAYMLNGKLVLRGRTGTPRERMMRDPALYKVREHQREFAAQSATAKVLRRIFASVKHLADPYFHGRTLKYCANIMKKDDGAHGQRTISFSRFGSQLLELELNEAFALRDVIGTVPAASLYGKRECAQVTLAKPAQFRFIPKGATHARFTLVAGIIGDNVYDTHERKFIFRSPELNGISTVIHSDYIPTTVPCLEPLTLKATLPVTNIPDDTTVVCALGVAFFQEEKNGQFLVLNQGKGMRVVAVL